MLLNLVIVAGLACMDLPGIDDDLGDIDIAAVESLAVEQPDCGLAQLYLGRAKLNRETISDSVKHLVKAVSVMPASSISTC